MRHKISIAFLALLFSSCGPTKYYFQLVELSSEKLKEGKCENQDIEVNIDFWRNGGTSAYSIFNKSNKTIYIKYDECQVIKNGLTYDLYDNSKYTSTRGIISSKTEGSTQQQGTSSSQSESIIYGKGPYTSTPWNALGSVLSKSFGNYSSTSNYNSATSTISNAKSKTSTDKIIYVLHPKSYRNIDGVPLQLNRFLDCDVSDRVSTKKSNIENGISYTKENSPLNVRIIITYSFDENFEDKKTYEVDAYINRFSNWSTDKFIIEEKYQDCLGRNKYRDVAGWYSPMRYYNQYR